MRKFIHLKYLSWILLGVILAVTINGVIESAHAMQDHTAAANDQVAHPDISATHNCPCSPADQHNDNDCCDTFCNCTCHASLTVQPFQLSYNPVISDLCASDPFKFLPEVYLTKFIPPQIQA